MIEPTTRPIATAEATATMTCTRSGHEFGTADSATTGIITPTSQAPVLTGTHRAESGTTVRSTRHWRNPIAARANSADGASTATATTGGTSTPVARAEPPMPTSQATAAEAAVASTHRRRDSAGQRAPSTRAWAVPSAAPSPAPATVRPATNTASDAPSEASSAPVTAGGMKPTNSPITNAPTHRRHKAPDVRETGAARSGNVIVTSLCPSCCRSSLSPPRPPAPSVRTARARGEPPWPQARLRCWPSTDDHCSNVGDG